MAVAPTDFDGWLALETEAWRAPRIARNQSTAPNVQRGIVNSRTRVWNGMNAVQQAAAAGAVRNFRQDQAGLAIVRANNPISPAPPADLGNQAAMAAYRFPLQALRTALATSIQVTTQLRNIRNVDRLSAVTAQWLTSIEADTGGTEWV